MLIVPRQPVIYRQSFARHLHGLAISGFYARGLDADDHAFLEKVRVRGIANGELPNVSAVLTEELDFWHLPYTIDRSVMRRAGPVTLRGDPETPAQKAARAARSAEWHKRRMERNRDLAIAAAEMDRERKAWEDAEKQRKIRAAISDMEWEAAAPKRKFGKVVDRHYVPQWKIDEHDEHNERRRTRRRRMRSEAANAERVIAEQAAAEQTTVVAEKLAKDADSPRTSALYSLDSFANDDSPPWAPVRPVMSAAVMSAALGMRSIYLTGLKQKIIQLVRAHAPDRCSIEQLVRWTRYDDPALIADLLEEVEEFALRYRHKEPV